MTDGPGGDVPERSHTTELTDEFGGAVARAFARPPWDGWEGPSEDPNDEQFGDVIRMRSFDSASDPGTDSEDETGPEADVLIVGEPYDGGVIGRRGAREGPIAIRRSLAGAKTHHFDAGAVGSDHAIRDLGDVRTVREPTEGVPGPRAPSSVAAVQERVREVTAAVLALDPLPVFLGGDNSLTVANAAPLAESTTLGIVNFDAHLDCRGLADGPSSGTPYRQLFEAGLDTYVCVGARHFETSTAYAEYVRERDGTVVTAETVGADRDGALGEVRTALEDVETLYLSVDLDVLDATAAPGVSAPTPGGLTTRDLFALVRRLASADRDRLAGLEVVECAPPLDESGRTADAAAGVVAHGLAGYLADSGTRRPNGGSSRG